MLILFVLNAIIAFYQYIWCRCGRSCSCKDARMVNRRIRSSGGGIMPAIGFAMLLKIMYKKKNIWHF